MAKVKEVKKGLLISKVKYPIFVKYNKENMRVSPRARIIVEDISLLTGVTSEFILRELK